MTDRDRNRPRRARLSWVAASAAVAATYVYFLIFAQFAFLEMVRTHAAADLRLVMGAMGAGGVAGAFIAAIIFSAARQRVMLTWTFRAGAVIALLAAGAVTTVPFVVVAAGVGLALGALTVTLAASLRGATGGSRLGLAIGVGTGLAYALCNLPGVFEASPRAQAFGAALVVAGASFLPWAISWQPVEARTTGDFSRWGVGRWVIVLLALVGMDSAAFYIVQHTVELRAATWSGPVALLGNALVHLGAALTAGAMLDRGRAGVVAALATGALVAACLVLNGVLPALIPAAWAYTAGVSLYSTVLVEYPARSGRPGVAAVVFAVAGWVGSALGIGMAQDLARIPLSFVVVAGGAVMVALIARAKALRARTVAVAAVVLAAGDVQASDDEAAWVGRGREVYIAEGCLHCHSQYVRPRVKEDVERWGPATELEAALRAAPPLFGNRRQGPDLANVGNRRTLEWNRLHLQDPRALSPGSRMPRYAHLFAPGDDRGEALVTYLASLGAETGAERQALIAAWRPAREVVTPPAVAQVRFRQLCAPCHGVEGRGDGPLAAKLSLPPPDWSRTAWRNVRPGADVETAISRIIKFGLPGRSMAGHEYLPDGDVVGLARWVRTMHKEGKGGVVAVVPP